MIGVSVTLGSIMTSCYILLAHTAHFNMKLTTDALFHKFWGNLTTNVILSCYKLGVS